MSNGYPSDWDSRRQEVYKRDGYTCQNCGRQGGDYGTAELHAHHVVPKVQGGTHAKSNLTTVCKQCHKAVHGDSLAPTSATTSVPGHDWEGWLDQLSGITADTGELAQMGELYMSQLSAATDGDLSRLLQMSDTEDTLRQRGFDLKTKLAAFDPDGGPPEISAAFVEDLSEYISKAVDFVELVFDLMDKVEEIRRESLAADTYNCPDCELPVDPEASFCSSCGAELPFLTSCPECESNITPMDRFCSNCGNDLPEPEEESVRGSIEQLGAELEKIMSEGADEIAYFTAVQNRITLQAAAVNTGTLTQRVEWRYCPNCGFRHSVYDPGGVDAATCFVCQMKWQEQDSGQLQADGGELEGEVKPDDEWERLGEEHHDEAAYKSYLDDGTSMDGDEIEITYIESSDENAESVQGPFEIPDNFPTIRNDHNWVDVCPECSREGTIWLGRFQKRAFTVTVLKCSRCMTIWAHGEDKPYTYDLSEWYPVENEKDLEGMSVRNKVKNKTKTKTSRKPNSSVTSADSGCFIATAAYGTPHNQEIDRLRDFRDNILEPNRIGRILIRTYYRTSPPLADWISRKEWRRAIVRRLIIAPTLLLIETAFPAGNTPD